MIRFNLQCQHKKVELLLEDILLQQFLHPDLDVHEGGKAEGGEKAVDGLLLVLPLPPLLHQPPQRRPPGSLRPERVETLGLTIET